MFKMELKWRNGIFILLIVCVHARAVIKRDDTTIENQAILPSVPDAATIQNQAGPAPVLGDTFTQNQATRVPVPDNKATVTDDPLTQNQIERAPVAEDTFIQNDKIIENLATPVPVPAPPVDDESAGNLDKIPTSQGLGLLNNSEEVVGKNKLIADGGKGQHEVIRRIKPQRTVQHVQYVSTGWNNIAFGRQVTDTGVINLDAGQPPLKPQDDSRLKGNRRFPNKYATRQQDGGSRTGTIQQADNPHENKPVQNSVMPEVFPSTMNPLGRQQAKHLQQMETQIRNLDTMGSSAGDAIRQGIVEQRFDIPQDYLNQEDPADVTSMPSMHRNGKAREAEARLIEAFKSVAISFLEAAIRNYIEVINELPSNEEPRNEL